MEKKKKKNDKRKNSYLYIFKKRKILKFDFIINNILYVVV